ncbi:endomembrane system protein [Malassezia pachydermatis]
MHWRFLLRVLAILTIFVVGVTAANWDKDDIEVCTLLLTHQIFELQAALEESEGAGSNFYSIMGLRPSASLAEIRKAPDKNPDVPDAHKRFERLGLIHRILRDERRDRYNHFLSKGFPKWRGSGYYYARFRPGLFMVLAFLIAVSMGVQYLVQQYNWRRDQKRIENLRRSALAAAWGAWFQTPADAVKGTKPKSIPAQKKVHVPLHGFEDMPPAPLAGDVSAGQVDWDEEGHKIRKVLSAHHGNVNVRMVDVMVYSDSSMAIIDDETNEWITVEPLNEADAPSVKTTWPFTLAQSLLQRSSTTDTVRDEAQAPADEVDLATSRTETTTSATSTKAAKRRKRAGKA